MKLRTQAIIQFILFIVSWSLVTVFILTPSTQEKFDYLQENIRQNEIDRVEYGIYAMVERHYSVVQDWTRWDSAYNYVENPYDQFIYENITKETFISQNINYILLYDKNGNLAHGSGYDYIENNELIASEDLVESIYKYQDQNDIVLVNNRAFIFSHYKIYNSDESKQSKGSLAFIYELTNQEISYMSERLKEEILIQETYSRYNDEKLEKIHSEDTINAYFEIPYLNSDGFMLLKLVLSQDIENVLDEAIMDGILINLFAFIMISFIMFIGISRSVLRIEKLNKVVTEIRKDNNIDRHIEIPGKDEIAMLKDNINGMLKRIANMHKTLNKYATLDTLTGIYNRRSGFEHLEDEMVKAKNNNRILSICFIDINDLKYANDTFGHNEGDKYIQEVCTVIQDIVRSADVFCRLGGDEFLIILPQCTENNAGEVMSVINDSLKESNNRNDKSYDMSISFGIVEYDLRSDLTQYIEAADTKMYKAKQEYKKQKASE